MAVTQHFYILISTLLVCSDGFHAETPDGTTEKLPQDLPLSGGVGDWTVVNSNGSVKLGARVPGTIYTDLVRAGWLGDPYYRLNDVLYRWVAHDNWTYTLMINVSRDVLARRAVWLDCHGLDTVSRIYINGRLAQSTDIMFHRYTFDIKDLLREGRNRLHVVFTSPIHYAARRAASYAYRVPPVCPPPVQNGDCSFNFIRKQASSFSWDWGPSFPTMGIWKPLFLRVFDTVALREFTAVPTKDVAGRWHVGGKVFFDVADMKVQTEVTAFFSISSLLYQKLQGNISSTNSVLDYDFIITQDVALWWPHTHGTPTLYNLTLTVIAGAATSRLTHRVGFRSIELVQDAIPGAPGLSFYFRVNGEPVFMKGSNWIPGHSFQERLRDPDVRRLLESARDANMNMLRVWGGGIYERDSFYDIADELGILIWQDLMFACAMYPTDPAFLTMAETEVPQQIRRLMSHPSIAIWAGNNENEAALAMNWYNTSSHYGLYYNDYIKLYVDILLPIVTSTDPSRTYITSSPTNGVNSKQQGWVAKNPYNLHYGDLHYYNYVNDSWDWRTYPVARFVSEYGVQSWCSYETLLPVSEPADRVINSTFYQHRQHRTEGNTVLENSVASHLPLPKTKSKEEYFRHFIYLTQIDQAEAIRTESESLRRSQSSLREGDGHTMGALYWQLNDIWQAPTWSSIEYGGKWKMLHYYAKNFFSRSLISVYLNGSRIEVYYVEDPLPGTGTHPTMANEARNTNKLKYRTKERTTENEVVFESDTEPQHALVIKCFNWSSFQPLKTWIVPFTKPRQPAAQVYGSELSSLLSAAECPGPQHCLLHFSLHADRTTPSRVLLPVYPKHVLGLQRPNIQISRVTGSGDTFQVSLTADHIAAYVSLDSGRVHGRFSDNGFFMTAASLSLTFYCWDDDVTAQRLQSQLTVTSLSDVFL